MHRCGHFAAGWIYGKHVYDFRKNSALFENKKGANIRFGLNSIKTLFKSPQLIEKHEAIYWK